MREAEEFVDITLLFGEGHVKCHKVIFMILAGRSDYFHRMFLTSMVESALNEVPIEEISASTGVLLVDYLYTGRIKLTTRNAQDLLVASEMLLLGALKQNIEEFLCEQIESSNCISLLNFARM
ncbi:hypothetical protein CAPTEDRAFT_97200 [Capitella teleta]|uniref:BTB domain-containing protein n=1 Tax=Capitella teleta TaxID=283909 RepID=R7URN5_CAPTE|nr:hypothetical protein CAPTEDRAFT_97200 [Capitella teleta]|eukprot:ELU06557.1 hypothetical protein CAPTEDRAFT_97200 [Capitella teleta]